MWQRYATQAEADEHSAAIPERVELDDALRRYRQQAVVDELQGIHDDPKFPHDRRGHLARQISREQATLDAMVPTVVADRPKDRVTIVVYGCDDHSPEGEEAGRVHEPVCLTQAPCTCTTDPPFHLGHVPAGMLG